MDRHILPVIGSCIIPEIDKTDIESVLRPLWETKTVTAKKLRGRIERVLSWSTVKGYREGDNPAQSGKHCTGLCQSFDANDFRVSAPVSTPKDALHL